MRVKEILKINDQLNHFNVKLPDNPPQVELSNSPSLEQIYKAFHAFNIPYEILTIIEMQGVVRLMKKRYYQNDVCIKILDTLSRHLTEMENWLKAE